MTPDPQPCSLQLPPGQTLAQVTPLYMRKVTTVEHSPAPDPYPPFWPTEPRSVSLTRAQAGDTYREAGRSFAPRSLHTGPAPRRPATASNSPQEFTRPSDGQTTPSLPLLASKHSNRVLRPCVTLELQLKLFKQCKKWIIIQLYYLVETKEIFRINFTSEYMTRLVSEECILTDLV